MTNNIVFVNGGRFYDKSRLQKIIKLLDMGYIVQIGISCIGHTRNVLESENYKEALLLHYGKKLKYDLYYGCYNYSLINENVNL